jgi:predicted nucleic acid-binding Zn ribbon protein
LSAIPARGATIGAVPWQPLPSSSSPDPAPVADSVDRLLRSWGSASLAATGSVFADWAEIVGPQVAEHAHPRSLRDGVLVIGVTEPGWATQLRFLEADLLARIGQATGSGEVRSIQIRVLGS